jgi:prostatic aicd phosphatase
MLQLTTASYVYNSYNDELKRLKGGVFVKKAIGDWNAKIEEKLRTKIFLYAGHDSTVVNILSAMDVWEQQLPDYGITTIIELSEQKSTKTFGIEIYLKNSTGTHKLIIPKCGNFCPLNEVKNLLSTKVPKNWKEECLAKNENFSEPPPSGP